MLEEANAEKSQLRETLERRENRIVELQAEVDALNKVITRHAMHSLVNTIVSFQNWSLGNSMLVNAIMAPSA